MQLQTNNNNFQILNLFIYIYGIVAGQCGTCNTNCQNPSISCDAGPLPARKGSDTLLSVCRHGWPENRELSNKHPPPASSNIPPHPFRSPPVSDSELGLDSSTLPKPTQWWICRCSRQALAGEGLQIRLNLTSLFPP